MSGGAGGGGRGGAAVDAGAGGITQTGGQGGSPPDGGGTAACKPLGAIPRRLWRLSAQQWGRAVQTLLSLPSPPVLMSRGGEAASASFSDASLTVDAAMLYNLYVLAGAATDQIDPMVATTIAPCTATTADAQTDCASSFVQAFAARAYRRAITADEQSDLMAVYQDGAADGYGAGIELVMKAILQSPSFLFRTELGPRTLTADASGNYPDTALTPDEVASQLSFTLLGSIPDAALSAAAASGSLATKDGIAAQVNRLIADPAAQAYLTDTVVKWYGIGSVFEKAKDATLLSALSSTDAADQSAIQNDLWASAQRFVSSILWSGSGSFHDLFTAQTVYVNRRLAALYPEAIVPGGVTTDEQFVAAAWPASEGRSGLLTQPSYLWALSDPSANSIVKRGKAIHDNVVCQDLVGSPTDLSVPAAINVISCKSPDGARTLSTCDSEALISDARIGYEPCRVCHVQLDPYARVLQDFGPIGNYRTVDEAGRAIDSTATFFAAQPPVMVAGFPGSLSAPGSPLAPRTVMGAQALASAIISTGALDDCAVQRMVGNAIGSQVWTHDTCELAPIRAASDGTIQSLLVNVLLADFMRARGGGPK